MQPRRYRLHAVAASAVLAAAVTGDALSAAATPTRPAPITAPGSTGVRVDQVDLGLEDLASTPPPPAPLIAFTGPATNLTGNAVGCQSNCITSALLSKQALTSSLGFQISTNVATRTHVWISTNSIQVIQGIPVFPGVAPKAVSPGFSGSWSTTLGGLAYDTTYNVIVRATDLYGNQRYATTSIRTIDHPGGGGLIGNGDGCYFDCITHGYFLEGDDYSEVVLSAFTSVPADIEFFVSTQEPGWIGSNPILPADEATHEVSHSADGASIKAYDLSAGTTYNVLVRATDDDGFTDYALGQFTTDTPPPVAPEPEPVQVVIGFERVTIVDDGDTVGQGEITLAWGLDVDTEGAYVGTFGEEKLDDGDVVNLPSGSATWWELEADGSIPSAVVNSIERDGGWVPDCLGSAPNHLNTSGPYYDDECKYSLTLALTTEHTLASIESLPDCSEYGFTGDKASYKCDEISSGDLGGEYADFEAIVSYRVL